MSDKYTDRNVLREFVRDVLIVGPEEVGDDWPDLVMTFNNAQESLAQPASAQLDTPLGKLEAIALDDSRHQSVGLFWDGQQVAALECDVVERVIKLIV